MKTVFTKIKNVFYVLVLTAAAFSFRAADLQIALVHRIKLIRLFLLMKPGKTVKL
jgi:hypothetical protein